MRRFNVIISPLCRTILLTRPISENLKGKHFSEIELILKFYWSSSSCVGVSTDHSSTFHKQLELTWAVILEFLPASCSLHEPQCVCHSCTRCQNEPHLYSQWLTLPRNIKSGSLVSWTRLHIYKSFPYCPAEVWTCPCCQRSLLQ